MLCYRQVQLDVNNEREQRAITNVFGVIEGYEEPGKFKFIVVFSALQ